MRHIGSRVRRRPKALGSRLYGSISGTFGIIPLHAAPALLNHPGHEAIVPQQFQGRKGESMDSFEVTKIFGALLAVALVVSLSSFIANELLPAHRGEARAYAVAVEAEPQEAPEITEGPAESVPDLAVLLAAADPAAGKNAIRRCTACHSLNEGAKHRSGPNLWDLIGRPVASAAGYNFSPALKGRSGEIWSYDNLDAFLANPKAWEPGTKMNFAGLRRPGQRAELIAYLRSLSDNPAALPE